MSNTNMINLEEIREGLSQDGLYIINDWEHKSLIDSAREDYFRAQASLKLSPPKQKFHYLDLEKQPHRKLAIGSTNGIGDPYAQFLQTTYFSKNDPNYPSLGTIFSHLISLRNRIVGIDEDFGNNPVQDGFWNACRIHHYPSGGGFMVGHRDTHFPVVLAKSNHAFLQQVFILSKRGEDFHHGGGFVIDKNGNKRYYENEHSCGSIVFFDGSIVHGVDDVDSDQIVDFNSRSGRIAAFTNLYQLLD